MSDIKDSDWFKQETTEVRGYFMKAPYDKVFIGCRPTEGMTKDEADKIDAIVNVSTEPLATFYPSRPNQRTYWYPVIEPGRWSLGYLCWLVRVMDFHYEQGHQIYLHCHAGAFRSPSAAVLWLISRGHAHNEAAQLCKEGAGGSWLFKHWERQGNLPHGWKDMLRLLRQDPRMGPEHLEAYRFSNPWDHELTSGYVRRSRLKRHYFSSWYKAKYKYQDVKRELGYFFRKEGYVRDGACTSSYDRKHFWVHPSRAEPLEIPKRDCWGWQWSAEKMAWVQVKKWDKEKGDWVNV